MEVRVLGSSRSSARELPAGLRSQWVRTVPKDQSIFRDQLLKSRIRANRVPLRIGRERRPLLIRRNIQRALDQRHCVICVPEHAVDLGGAHEHRRAVPRVARDGQNFHRALAKSHRFIPLSSSCCGLRHGKLGACGQSRRRDSAGSGAPGRRRVIEKPREQSVAANPTGETLVNAGQRPEVMEADVKTRSFHDVFASPLQIPVK